VLPAPDAAQTRGSYDLIDRLRQAFPQVEIESCASGGGRIDAGILSRTHRVACSSAGLPHIRFRAWVAAHRHMGFEMDPRE